MEFVRRAIAVAIVGCLVVSSTPAEAWTIAPVLHAVSKPIFVFQFQALSQPADVFAHNGITESAALAVDQGATLQRVNAFGTNPERGYTTREALGFFAGLGVVIASGYLADKLWPVTGLFVGDVPLPAWVVSSMLLGLAWFIFSPVQRVRRAAHIPPSLLPKGLRPLIRKFGVKPFKSIAKDAGKYAEEVFGPLSWLPLDASQDELVKYGEYLVILAKAAREDKMYIKARQNVEASLEEWNRILRKDGNSIADRYRWDIKDLELTGRIYLEGLREIKYLFQNVGLSRPFNLINALILIRRSLKEPMPESNNGDYIYPGYGYGTLGQRSGLRGNPDPDRYRRGGIDSLISILQSARFAGSSEENKTDSLPTAANENMPVFAAIAQAAGVNRSAVFQFALPPIEDLIKLHGFSQTALLIARLKDIRSSLNEPGMIYDTSAGQYNMYSGPDPDGPKRIAIDTLISILQEGKIPGLGQGVTDGSESRSAPDSRRGMNKLGFTALIAGLGVANIVAAHFWPVIAPVLVAVTQHLAPVGAPIALFLSIVALGVLISRMVSNSRTPPRAAKLEVEAAA